MAYAERYYHAYCNPQGLVCRVSFQEWNYVGPSSEVDAAPQPFVKTIENSSMLKIGGVYPSTATVTFISSPTFNMELLYTADETKYLIQHIVDGVQDWVGNVVPNGFSEERHGENRMMVVMAADRLTVLQGIRFEDENGQNYGLESGQFEQSLLWAIKECLKKTGFLLPIWSMVDIKPIVEDDGFYRALLYFTVDSSTLAVNFDTPAQASEFNSQLSVGMEMQFTEGELQGENHTIASFGVAGENPRRVNIVIEDTFSQLIPQETGTIYFSFAASSDYPDPLAQTVHDVRTWVNNADEVGGRNYFEQRQTAKFAWEVLDAIARQWNIRVMMNGDHWELVRWNAYKHPDGQYQWYVYNSEGTQIGRRPFGSTAVFPCPNDDDQYELFGSQGGMDRVLKGANVNYTYKYKTDGDSLVNLIRNGLFNPPNLGVIGPDPTQDPWTYTPDQWRRVRQAPVANMSIQYHSAISPVQGPPGGIPFIEMSGNFHSLSYLTTETGYATDVAQGDRLIINFWFSGKWHKSPPVGGQEIWTAPMPVIRIFVRKSQGSGDRYQLVNDGPNGPGDVATDEGSVATYAPAFSMKSQWVPYSAHEDDSLAFEVQPGHRMVPAGAIIPREWTKWRKFEIETPPIPMAGYLVVELTGFGLPLLLTNGSLQPSPTPRYSRYVPVPGGGGFQYQYEGGRYSLNANPLFGRFASMFAGKITDPSSEAVPQIHAYTYPDPVVQRTRNYTDSIGDIEVLTGDDNDPDHVSNIYFLRGSTRFPVNQWDTWQNEFGWSALGLLLAKSIMEQYWVPWHIIEGSFVHPGLNWSTRFQLEDRPGETYVILRGNLIAGLNMFIGTLVQVWEDGMLPLPPGGNDGGNTTDPQWVPTGATRCERVGGLNTGSVLQLEVDVNQASPTYGQERWMYAGHDETMCPVGEPIAIYWGEQLALDVETLRTQPFTMENGGYRVTYNNDGGNRYLRFLHLASLGTISSILYQGNFESISGWVYEPDVVIDGYTYKHIRLSWYVGVFTNLPVIFVIE